MSTTEPLYETTCADAIHSVIVTPRSHGGFSIQIVATESGIAIGLPRVVHSEQAAIDYANRIAEGSAI